jgi:hypothetical protein
MDVNVREPWEMHDTLVVRPTLYGSESAAGYFTTFAAFGQRNDHLFFKRRSEGNVHRAYCNQQSEDRTDFVMQAFEVGLLFTAPPTPLQGSWGDTVVNEFMVPFWTEDLPRHCAASLKIGQDTNLVLNAMMMSPGYGPQTSGAAQGVDTLDAAPPPTTYIPEMIWTAVQGVPVPQSRYWIASGGFENPTPIGIPKGELVELKLEISEHARNILQGVGGPGQMRIGGEGEGPSPVYIDAQFGIQASIWGYREVQQRGELRAS